MAKTVITVNGAEGKNIFPAIIIGVSSAASGDDVVLFFTPSGAPTMVKGAIEKLKEETKNMPDIVEMLEGLIGLGAKLLVCELAFDVHGFKEEDLREGCEVVGATTFVGEATGCELSLSF
ncbi:DsrE/DsrF/DrsH-like family protein [candidate division KSB1 bacterium]|nr:DsrE/DsrF/DrsH-like family protein [candidate division KSB1 bacterium]